MSHETYELKAEARERVGKGSARELRRNGLIPAVIYGDKQAPISIALSTNEVTKRIHAGGFMTTIATIDVGGKKYKVLPKDYQLDPVRDFTMHVDFLRVSGNTPGHRRNPGSLHQRREVPGPEGRRRSEHRSSRQSKFIARLMRSRNSSTLTSAARRSATASIFPKSPCRRA